MNIIREWYKKNFIASLHCLVILKYQQYFVRKNNRILARTFQRKNIKTYGVHIGLETTIGENLMIPHPCNIVLGEGVNIGKNCCIYQGVTLGKKLGHLNNVKDYPTLEDNVTIFPGSMIFGNITIGKGSIIGAGSVVTTNVEPYSIYAGNPAKKIKDIKVG